MKSHLERQWYFIGPSCMCAVFLTRYVMEMAGIARIDNFAHWIIFIFCVIGFQRAISFLGWLLVLGVSPAAATRGQEKPAAGPR